MTLDRLGREAAPFLTPETAAFLGQAALTTLLLTAAGCGIGLLLGGPVAYLRGSTAPALAPARLALAAYVETFRRLPFLIVLFLVLFAVQAVSPSVPLFAVATLAIVLMATAFLSEIVRAGLESVPRPQVEAAAVLNLTRWQAARLVVVPQAWRVILPPAAAYCVMFVKDTALASQAGVVELMFAGKILNNRGFSPLLVYGSVLLIYFAISWPLARAGAQLEGRLTRRLAPPRNA